MFLIDLIFAAFDWLIGRLFRRRKALRGSATRMTGDRAEHFALEFLRKDGFSPLERNLNDPRGELDLVGRQQGFDGTVVVEVRARGEGSPVDPHATVRPHKQRQVVRSAQRLLRRHGIGGPVRFDIVGVWLDAAGNPVRAERFANAFGPGVLKRRKSARG